MDNKRFVIKIDKNSILTPESIAFILFFSGNSIAFINNAFFNVVGMSAIRSYSLICIHCITALCILIGLAKTEAKTRNKTIFFVLFVAILILFGYIFHPEIRMWLTHETYGFSSIFGLNGHIFTSGVMAFCVIIIQRDYEKLFKLLKVCSIFLMIYLLIMTYQRLSLGYFMISIESGIREKADNMSYGYYCAFVSTIHFTLWRKEKHLYSAIIGVMFALFAVMFGSRGSVIIFGIYFACVLWTSLRNVNLARRVAITILILFLSFLIVSFYSTILLGIQRVMYSFGITNSRIITSLISGDILESNGREGLWELGVSLIKEKFPFGYGALGERNIVGGYLRWGYLHNVILEIIVEFGLVGVAFLIYIVLKAGTYINDKKNSDLNLLFILFFSNCGMLLVSNSFWYHPYFWATLGLGVIYGKFLKGTRYKSIIPSTHIM